MRLSRPLATKCVSLDNPPCIARPILIDFNSSELCQGLSHYPCAITLDGFHASCNTLNNFSDMICVPNKTENVNLSVFNMIA